MRYFSSLLVGLLAACTPKETPPLDTTDTGPAPGADTANDVNPEDLYGVVPASALGAPEFTAINHDGTTRTRDDLLGHRTVMWFFPFAMTPG